MTQAGDGAGNSRESDAVLVAAGLADLVFSGIGAAVSRVREVLRRSDLAELAQDGQEELRARGLLALRRNVPMADSHMELLARRSAARPGRRDV